MSDPLERAKLLIDEAARERDQFRNQKNAADSEKLQLRRKLARAEEARDKAEQLNNQLQQQIERFEQAVAQSRRALLDHAART